MATRKNKYIKIFGYPRHHCFVRSKLRGSALLTLTAPFLISSASSYLSATSLLVPSHLATRINIFGYSRHHRSSSVDRLHSQHSRHTPLASLAPLPFRLLLCWSHPRDLHPFLDFSPSPPCFPPSPNTTMYIAEPSSHPTRMILAPSFTLVLLPTPHSLLHPLSTSCGPCLSLGYRSPYPLPSASLVPSVTLGPHS